MLSAVRKKIEIKKSVWDVLPDIPLLDIPLENGDLFVLKNWNPEGLLTYQHAGMISDVSTLTRIDCVPKEGCRIKPFNSNKKGREIFIARLPLDIPYREEIIQEGISISTYLIKNQKVTYLDVKQYRVSQFLRILVGRCMGKVGWEELTTYIERFLSPYINQTKYGSETFTIFCNRFSMLIYQLSAWYVWKKHNKTNHEISQLLNQYFAFHSKYCRPWHILMLGQDEHHPWTVFRSVTWGK